MAEATEAAPRRGLATVGPSLLTGLVAGLMAVTFMYSYSAVILADADQELIPRLTGHFFIGGIVISLIVGLTSQFRGVVALPQDTSTAVLAVIVGSVAAGGTTDSETLFVTVLMLIVLSTFAGAILFWLVGRFRLAILGQYVPYPVVAGFLTAAGWLLFKASFAVMTPTSFDLGDLSALRPDAELWLPGAVMAVGLVVVSRRSRNPLVVPGAIVVFTVGYHVIRLSTGESRSEAIDDGYLLEPLGSGPLVESVDLSLVEWSVIGDQAVGMATVLIITIIGVLLNVTALGSEFRQDVDVDREMRLLGVSNLIASGGGSILGYHLVSLSTLGRRMRGDSRLVGVTLSAVCLFSATVGAGWLSYIPQFVLGGVVMFIGLSLMTDWLLRSFTKLARGDLAIVIAILAVVELVGFLEGVAAGLLVAIVLFVVTYSRTGAIRHVFTGREMRSTVERSTAHRTALQPHEDGIVFVKLHGYVFFASTVGLVDAIRGLIADPERDVTHLILDFEHVTGVDASGFEGLMKVHATADGRAVSVVYASIDDDLETRLRGAQDAAGVDHGGSPVFSTSEAALEWCENDVLRRTGIDPYDDEFSFDYTLREMFGDVGHLEEFRSRLEIIDIPAGETLIESGARAGHLDFVESGRLVVLSSERDETRIRRAGPGSILGIAAFFRHGGQTSLVTLRAETDCRIRRLTGDAYFRLVAEEPQIAAALQRHVLVTISDRFSVLLSSYESVMKSKL